MNEIFTEKSVHEVMSIIKFETDFTSPISGRHGKRYYVGVVEGKTFNAQFLHGVFVNPHFIGKVSEVEDKTKINIVTRASKLNVCLIVIIALHVLYTIGMAIFNMSMGDYSISCNSVIYPIFVILGEIVVLVFAICRNRISEKLL